MIMLIDTREKKPLNFESKYFESTESATLKFGDYVVRFRDGHIPPFYFERKSLPDLLQTMSFPRNKKGGYYRFKKELIRAQKAEVQLMIIVEGTLSKVMNYYNTDAGLKAARRMYDPDVSIDRLIKRLFTLHVKHGIPTIYCRDRMEMRNFITQFYLAVGREYLRRQGKRKL